MALFDQPIPAMFDTTAAPQQPEVTFRRFDDIEGQREAVYDNARRALQSFQPLENATHRLEIADVDYESPFTPTKADEKKAIMQGSSLQRPLRGTVRLLDRESGQPLDEQRVTLARIPHVNSRGLFIRNGVVWSVRNQARLRPGAYTRRRADGGTETQFNVKHGTGRGFRLQLDPESGVLKMQVGQSTTRLYPLLRAMGIEDEELKEAWGEDLFNANYRPPSGNDAKDIRKAVSKLGSSKIDVDEDQLPQALKDIIERAEIDPDTAEITLGQRVSNLSPGILVDATRKVLGVARGELAADNRDSQAFQSIHGVEDFVRERLEKDPAGVLRRVLWKAGREGKLGNIQSGILDKNVGSLFEGSGLAMSVEDINPFEIHDMRQAITRMGEGGISSEQAVSRDARGVQPSYLGVIDAGRGPESSRLGLDLRVTDAALKGSDNQLYTTVRDPRTGEEEIVSARTLSSRVVTFPGEWDGKRSYVQAQLEDGTTTFIEKASAERQMLDPEEGMPRVVDYTESRRIPAVKDGEIQYVLRDEVDYEIPNPNSLMSRATAMIPFPQSIKGQRLLMGARMMQQAMPLREPEAPLVQTAGPDGSSLHSAMGPYIGAAYAPSGGTVLAVTPDQIKLQGEDGEVRVVDLYNNYPTARKTMIHNTPVVQKGDYVEDGQLLARSNFTDDTGTAAVGRNLRVAFMAAEGDTIEDAFVISESAAKKLTSEALYKSDLDMSDVETTDKDKYRAVYTDKYTPEQYEKIGEDGVISVGEEVQPGDPLIIGFGRKGKKAVGAVMDTPRSELTDRSQTWDHHAPGVVTDVSRTRKGIKVTVRSYDTMRAADKLSGRFGNKGVISEIRPDDQMPQTEDGQPVEVIANALGIISRTNPGALAEALLGKVARVRGEPYAIKGFDNEDVAEFALQEALKYGVIRQDPETGQLIDTETLVDPRDGSKIPEVFTGESYMLKLHHMAESKMGARDSGGYTVEGLPARGGKEGSKRVAVLDSHSLLAAGAVDFLKDAKLIRGQRNDEYWRAVRAGETPLAPDRSFANEHFENLLRGAGVNLRKEGTRTQLAPMLDDDVDALADHEIENPGTFNFETMEPVKGGLFDIGKTGGAGGNRFSKITLPAPIPHPLFIDPIQKMLGMTRKELDETLSGQRKLGGKTGPEAIQSALADIDIERDMTLAKEDIRTGRGARRDAAVKRLNYLKGLQDMQVQPDQLMITKLPVVPPKYRPITSGRNMDMVHDLNYLYHDLLEARQNYSDALETFGSAGDEYGTMSDAVQAISGVRDPVYAKSAEQGVKGILRHAIGIGDTPKAAFYQRKVIGSAVDNVGRGVIAADADLDMDEIGIPKDMAFKIYRPYLIRNLVRSGIESTDAVRAVQEQSPIARKALDQVIEEIPVSYNRAPALHRYAYVGAKPVIRDDDAIGLPYQVLKGIGGDYDGDQINVHVPSSPEAIKDVREKLMPSKNLFFTGDFETHLEPMQDYLAGLYLASTPDTDETVQTFASEEEARRAFAQGKINARTPIRILP